MLIYQFYGELPVLENVLKKYVTALETFPIFVTTAFRTYYRELDNARVNFSLQSNILMKLQQQLHSEFEVSVRAEFRRFRVSLSTRIEATIFDDTSKKPKITVARTSEIEANSPPARLKLEYPTGLALKRHIDAPLHIILL